MPEKRVKNNQSKKPNGNPIKDSVGSFNSLNESFRPTSEQAKEIIDKFKAIINTRLDQLYDTRGADGEMYAYGIAVNQVKKKAEQPEETPAEEASTEDTMDKDQKLKEMIQAALSKPLSEKKAKPDFLDIDKDGDKEESMKKAAQDKKKMQMEDLDLGHQDDEPHMIKGELYKIAQNALALYKMLKPFDKSDQEVDFPAWWQSKITKACTMLGSAKNYLEFELKEPQIDAMVNIASEEGAIEEMSKKQIKKRGEIYDTLKDKGMSDEKAGKIATSQAMKAKIKEAVLAKLKSKK
jgi:hypothetical protein